MNRPAQRMKKLLKSFLFKLETTVGAIFGILGVVLYFFFRARDQSSKILKDKKEAEETVKDLEKEVEVKQEEIKTIEDSKQQVREEIAKLEEEKFQPETNANEQELDQFFDQRLKK